MRDVDSSHDNISDRSCHERDGARCVSRLRSDVRELGFGHFSSGVVHFKYVALRKDRHVSRVNGFYQSTDSFSSSTSCEVKNRLSTQSIRQNSVCFRPNNVSTAMVRRVFRGSLSSSLDRVNASEVCTAAVSIMLTFSSSSA
ncbi:hypothetical protein PINS_up006063 [Pythium insidiosum]|nr:hypothetical protein PINS_up006063 [Pythium insidiosum]